MDRPEVSSSTTGYPAQDGGPLAPQSVAPDSQARLALDSAHGDKLRWFRQRFRPHFDSWVFGPIDRLVLTDDALIGFIVMACAIDYLAGFWWGEDTRYSGKKSYTGFIDQYFRPGRYSADDLWDSLRNGLVHMFTIKGRRYALTHNHPELHLKVTSSGHTLLNAADLRDDLRDAKDRFFDEVESHPVLLDKVVERQLREGFLGPIQLIYVPT